MKMKKLFVTLCAAVLLAGCASGTSSQSKEDKTLTIGASVTPHAEILNHIKPVLEEKGYNVEIKQFTDYDLPNKGLAEGSLDANYFQHKPYLDEWMVKAKEEGKLTSVFAVHFEPLGIYSVKHKDLNVKEKAVIGIPNDPTNGGRALKLLEANGIIKLTEGKGIDATINDIVENPKNVEVKPMVAENCAKNIQDLDYAVVNGNNALNAKISDKVLATEDKTSEAAQKYANIIAVQKGHEDDQKIKDLIDALNSEDVKKFIEDEYDGIVVPLVPAK